MASSETFDVILRLLMDEAALGRIKSGASTVAKEFEKVDDKTEEVTKEIQRQEKIAIAAMKQEASAIRKVAAARAKEIGELKERAAWLEKGSKAMFAVGVGGLTAITLIARKYIESTEESNEITKAWAASTEKVNDAQMRIGKIAAEAVLPIYEKLADIAQKGAEFIEKNPGAIEAGLKTSIVLAGLGGLGMLAAKGLRLYADIQMIAVGDMQLAAAKIMSDAATKQLTAAGGGSGIAKGLGVGTAATKAAPVVAGAAGLSAGTIAGIVAGVIAGQIALASLGQAVGNLAGLSQNTTDTILTLLSLGIYPLFKNLGQWINVQLGLVQATDASVAATSRAAQVVAEDGSIVSQSYYESASAMNQAAQVVAEDGSIVSQSYYESANAMNQAAQVVAEDGSIVSRSYYETSNAMSQNAFALQNFGNSISSFIQRIISSFGNIKEKIPVHDYTGYAYTRTYAMAQDGKRQFVMSGGMTRLAEQMLGSQLNEQMVMSALTAGAGGRGSVTWNDQRRFSGEYTKSMRHAQRADTLAIFDEVAKKIK